MEHRAGQQRGDGIRSRQQPRVLLVDVIEVVRADRSHLDRQPDGSGMRELLGVNLQQEPEIAGGGEITAHLLESESAALVVDVGENCQPVPPDAGMMWEHIQWT